MRGAGWILALTASVAAATPPPSDAVRIEWAMVDAEPSPTAQSASGGYARLTSIGRDDVLLSARCDCAGTDTGGAHGRRPARGLPHAGRRQAPRPRQGRRPGGGPLAGGGRCWRIERRVPAPMLDLSLFRSWLFSAGTISAVLNYVSLYGIVFLMPFYLIQGRGLNPAQAGLVLTAQPLVMAFAAPLSGALRGARQRRDADPALRPGRPGAPGGRGA